MCACVFSVLLRSCFKFFFLQKDTKKTLIHNSVQAAYTHDKFRNSDSKLNPTTNMDNYRVGKLSFLNLSFYVLCDDVCNN